MTENEVIQEIFDTFKLNHAHKGFGPFGDDAVIIPPPSAQDHLVLSTDSFSDGTHFDSNIEWEAIGWKALVASLSDIVAMGAQPSFYMLNLILPKSFDSHKSLISGLYRASKCYNVDLLGGDVARGESLTISITVGGYQPQTQVKKNIGAGVGDLIFTNAPLGYSLLGFEQHKKGIRDTIFTKEFLYPQTPVELGLWLSKTEGVTTLRDISDGLLSELRQFSKSHEQSVQIFKQNFHDEFEESCKHLDLNKEEVFLKGGEDYRLLWTIKEKGADLFETDYIKKFKTPPIKIGEVKELSNEPKIYFDPNQSLTDSIMPFEHFSS